MLYIGKSFGDHRVEKMERKKEHYRDLKNSKHPSKDIQRLYDLHGEESIKFEIIQSFDSTTDEELMEKEIYYIEKYGTYINGSNKTIGGSTVTGLKHNNFSKKKMSESIKGEKNHFYGKTHTIQTRQKISEKNKGKILSDEQKEAVSKQWKGVPKSEEHRRKISEAHKGRNFSEETLKKMSEAKKGLKWTNESKRKRLMTIKKLTDDEINEIYIRANKESISNKELGKIYGIGQTLVSNIKNLKINYIKEIINKQQKPNQREILTD